MNDPFKNDPFFNGNDEEFMSSMPSFADMSEMPEGNGNSHFVSTSMVSTTRTGEDGQPITIKQTKRSKGAAGNGNRLVESESSYENSATGEKKTTTSKNMNGRGRKVTMI